MQMEFIMYAYCLQIFIILSLFSINSHSLHPIENLTTCLISHKIHNFSLHDKDPITYFKLLDFSIQNLRFKEFSIPKPLAIIIPRSKEDLINSVRCCRNGSWEIRVRSGGHSYEGTSYIANDGCPFVLIDIMNLNKVSIDLESETAWVEGGATLGETYYAISKLSKIHAFPGGSCPTVGTGGQISGGGFGSLFRKYGLAADNVVDAVLIDANGFLLDRKGMREEVFWAIRGGGGGVFGIVYAWKIRLVRVPQVLTGFIVSRAGSKFYVGGLIEKWQNVAPKLDDEFYLSLVLGADLPEGRATGISATFKGLYLGPRKFTLSILNDRFPELGILEEDCQEMSWIESIVYFSGLTDLTEHRLSGRTYYKAKSDFVRRAFSINGISTLIETLEKEPKGYAILDPYGGAMAKISSESLPFPHRKGNIFMIQYVVEWKNEDSEKSADYVNWIRRFYDAMAPYVSSGPRATYINYMDFDIGSMENVNCSVQMLSETVEKARVWGEKYFLGNYDRLVRAKTLVDPLNIFRHAQGIFPYFTGNENVKIQMMRARIGVVA